MKGSTKYWIAKEKPSGIVQNVKMGGALGDEIQCGQGIEAAASSPFEALKNEEFSDSGHSKSQSLALKNVILQEDLSALGTYRVLY